jgi:ABC-type dipeptide/oligopeptide/nickel transport system permease subunit
MTDERSSAFGVVQRTIEILDGIPNLVVAILAMVVLHPGIVTISIAIGLTGWTYMAGIVCGKMLQLKDQEFGLASRSLGAGRFRLVWKHLIPSSLGPHNNLRDVHRTGCDLRGVVPQLHRARHPDTCA